MNGIHIPPTVCFVLPFGKQKIKDSWHDSTSSGKAFRKLCDRLSPDACPACSELLAASRTLKGGSACLALSGMCVKLSYVRAQRRRREIAEPRVEEHAKRALQPWVPGWIEIVEPCKGETGNCAALTGLSFSASTPGLRPRRGLRPGLCCTALSGPAHAKPAGCQRRRTELCCFEWLTSYQASTLPGSAGDTKKLYCGLNERLAGNCSYCIARPVHILNA